MAEVIKMPRLSDTMEEGTVAKWLKNVGDKVEEGDILAEIETDKATMEFESFYDGTLLHIGIAEGDTAPVDVLLAIIGEANEDISGLLNEEDTAASEVAATETALPETSEEAMETPASNPSAGAAIPEGVEVIKMPRLSDTMEEGTVASWLKNVGDTVEEGDILAEIETDKATMEFESFYSGTLLYVGIKEGETAPVDEVLAIIGPKGTDVDAVLQGGGEVAAAVTTATAEVTKATEVEVATSVTTVSQNGERIFASPLAKKIAIEKGINLEDVQGSGDNGRIVKRDVENYQPKTTTAIPAEKAQEPIVPTVVKSETTTTALTSMVLGEERVEEVKNSQMRKVIARRLSESKFTAPHYYLTIEIEMDNAMASRMHMNNLPDTKISFNDMVLKACAMALKKHPQVNTTWNGDTTKINHHVHLGVAVAVDEGLVVPVVRFADQLSLSQIGAKVKDMAGRARNKKLTPAEMEGSTFTVSNLGMFGISEFTSIINQPNSSILSVGAIVPTPVVREGQIVVRNMMKITMANDHRTVDGATGAQFLQTLRSYLENPVTMLA